MSNTTHDKTDSGVENSFSLEAERSKLISKYNEAKGKLEEREKNVSERESDIVTREQTLTITFRITVFLVVLLVIGGSLATIQLWRMQSETKKATDAQEVATKEKSEADAAKTEADKAKTTANVAGRLANEAAKRAEENEKKYLDAYAQIQKTLEDHKNLPELEKNVLDRERRIATSEKALQEREKGVTAKENELDALDQKIADKKMELDALEKEILAINESTPKLVKPAKDDPETVEEPIGEEEKEESVPEKPLTGT